MKIELTFKELEGILRHKTGQELTLSKASESTIIISKAVSVILAKVNLDISVTIEPISIPNVVKASISVGNLADKLLSLANGVITNILNAVLPHEAYTMEGGKHITLYLDKVPQLQAFCEMFMLKDIHINKEGITILCDVLRAID